MRYNEFEHFFSAARASRYANAVGGRNQRTIKMYKANLRLAQSFHPLLGMVEVVLRNLINNKLTQHFNDPNWIISQKSHFMSHPSLTYTHKRTRQQKVNNFLKKQVENAERRLRKTRTTITSGKIIAEQTFGFWTDLFEVHHYRLLQGQPITIFSHLPAGYGRREVLKELHNIRRFRNRINHNEPICFQQHQVDFTESERVYQSIHDVLNWIDPTLLKFTKDLDRVTQVIKISKKI